MAAKNVEELGRRSTYFPIHIVYLLIPVHKVAYFKTQNVFTDITIMPNITTM